MLAHSGSFECWVFLIKCRVFTLQSALRWILWFNYKLKIELNYWIEYSLVLIRTFRWHLCLKSSYYIHKGSRKSFSFDIKEFVFFLNYNNIHKSLFLLTNPEQFLNTNTQIAMIFLNICDISLTLHITIFCYSFLLHGFSSVTSQIITSILLLIKLFFFIIKYRHKYLILSRKYLRLPDRIICKIS